MTGIDEAEARKARRWTWRRRMAIASFAAGLLYPIPCYFNSTMIQLAVAFYGFVTGIIVFYIGSATYDDAHGPQGG